MIHTQVVRDSSGNLLTSYNINTTNVITTEGINTERNYSKSALLLVQDGSITQITREVSVDNTNYYVPYDANGLSLANCGSAIPNSRYISLAAGDSGSLATPWTRFKFAGARTITTVSLWYMQEEQHK